MNEKGYPVADQAVEVCATTGQLDMLRWVWDELPCELDPALDEAVLRDPVHVIRWLVEHGCSLKVETLYRAAQYSTTAMVACLLDHNCPCDETMFVDYTCMNSADVDVLPFLAVTKG